jgi:hypothetical protein
MVLLRDRNSLLFIFRRMIPLLLVACTPEPKETAPPIIKAEPVPIRDASVPDAPEDAPEPLDEDAVLGAYETQFLLTKKNRSHNIKTAAARLNVIIPGGVEISFNELVGPRTEENGFKLAPVIFAGEMRDGIGGGVCQVSSTVHAAALYAGLEIVKWKPHSRTSKYIQPGLDATVSFPGSCLEDGGYCYLVDLVIRNSNPSRLGLRLSITEDKHRATLRAEFVGVEAKGKTKYRWYSRKGEGFEHKLRKVKWRPGDYAKKKQEGKDGLIVFSTLTVGDSERRWRSEYDPVDEVWEVGPDWDTDGPPPWAPSDPYE